MITFVSIANCYKKIAVRFNDCILLSLFPKNVKKPKKLRIKQIMTLSIRITQFLSLPKFRLAIQWVKLTREDATSFQFSVIHREKNVLRQKLLLLINYRLVIN